MRDSETHTVLQTLGLRAWAAARLQYIVAETSAHDVVRTPPLLRSPPSPFYLLWPAYCISTSAGLSFIDVFFAPPVQSYFVIPAWLSAGRACVRTWRLRVEFTFVAATAPIYLCPGVSLTLVDANHCPGAAMVVAQPPGGWPPVLHTGDCRLGEHMRSVPALQARLGQKSGILRSGA